MNLKAKLDAVERSFFVQCDADCGFSRPDDACDCGARAHNIRVRRNFKELREAIEDESQEAKCPKS